jgi:hypothetical protein
LLRRQHSKRSWKTWQTGFSEFHSLSQVALHRLPDS